MLGLVRCHRIVRKLDGAFVVFTNSKGSTLVMVNGVEELAEMDRALSGTTEGDVLGLNGLPCYKVLLLRSPTDGTTVEHLNLPCVRATGGRASCPFRV
jgi:hypothetical protein